MLEQLFTFSACGCDEQGSVSATCDASGKCSCKTEDIQGDQCSECAPKLSNFPSCTCKY